MDSEDLVSQKIRLEAAKHKIILWCNNSGAFKDADGRWIRYGLGNDSKRLNEVFKSSDFIMIIPTLITKEMVGQTLGVFGAVEVKKEGWEYNHKDDRQLAQHNFIQYVKNKFGRAGFAYSVDSFLKIIGK